MSRIHRAPLALALCLAACTTSPAAPTSDTAPSAGTVHGERLTPPEPGVLYAMGVGLGAQLDPLALSEAEARELSRGVVDAIAHTPEARRLLEERDPAPINAFFETRLGEVARLEAEASRGYLEQAARAAGAFEHENGMIVTILEQGEGDAPGIFDWVIVNYTGTLRDGTVFDRSPEGSIKKRLGVTVTCWQDALGMVAPPARLHLVCPASVAYGEDGISGLVPGGAVVVFDIELLKVIPGEDPTLGDEPDSAEDASL